MGAIKNINRIRLVTVTLTMIMLLATVNVFPAYGSPGWYDSGWAYRKKITVGSGNIAATLANFPMLVNITADTDLAGDAQNSGDDILFTSADGEAKLSHEIERYNGTEGHLTAWVKIPSLSDSTDTEIYMYYGNPSCGNQENAANVWSNGYEAVYHLHDDFNDAIGNHNASNAGSVDTTGKTADGQDFTPASEIQAGSWSIGGTAITLQAWLNPDDFDQDDPRVISKANGGNTNNHVFMLGLGGTGEQYLRGRIKTGTSDSSGTTTLVANTNPAATGTWQMLALTYDGSSMVLLKNGAPVATTGKTGNLRENSWDIAIGNNPGNADTGWASLDGKLDEIRVSSLARSSEWLTTEYNNQASPATFYTLGGEEAAAVATPVAVGGEIYQIDKLSVLMPWVITALAVAGIGVIFILRRLKIPAC